jgi:hypothetical protein
MMRIICFCFGHRWLWSLDDGAVFCARCGAWEFA